MAPQESIDIPECLKDSRAEFLAAAEGLSEAQAEASPAPGRWSVVECVEHVVVAETRFLGWLRNPIAEPPPPANKEKEAIILSRVAARATAVEAPEPVRPSGRFATFTEALAQFEAIRAQSIQFAESHGAGLYSLAAKHPFLGVCNGAEAMVLIAAHSRRHAAQIREIRQISPPL
jgi:DinB superfamily